jgi:hypothetical protein
LKNSHWAVYIFFHLLNYLTYFLCHNLANHKKHTKIKNSRLGVFFLVLLKHIAASNPA